MPIIGDVIARRDFAIFFNESINRQQFRRKRMWSAQVVRANAPDSIVINAQVATSVCWITFCNGSRCHKLRFFTARSNCLTRYSLSSVGQVEFQRHAPHFYPQTSQTNAPVSPSRRKVNVLLFQYSARILADRKRHK